MRDLEAELKELGAIGSRESLPEELIPGSLHEALDQYEGCVRRHNVRPGSTDLAPYGRLRLARIKRFKQAHDDIPLHAINYDACTAMAAYWKEPPDRPAGADQPGQRPPPHRRADAVLPLAGHDGDVSLADAQGPGAHRP